MLILNFHELDPSPVSEWSFEPDKLRALLQGLRAGGWSFPEPESLLARAAVPESPFSAREIMLTFDDCRRGAFRYGRAVLEEAGVQAMFFPVLSYLRGEPLQVFESYAPCMTLDELSAVLGDGHSVGSHGASHKPYFHCTLPEIEVDILDGKRGLETMLRRTLEVFSVPHGQVNRPIAEIAQRAGFTSILSADGGLVRPALAWPYVRRFSATASQSVAQLREILEDAVGRQNVVRVADCRGVDQKRWYWPTFVRARSYDLVVCRDRSSLELLARHGVPHLLLDDGGDLVDASRRYLAGMMTDPSALARFDVVVEPV